MATTSQLKEMFGAGQVITASNFEELIDYIDSVSSEAGGGVDSASFTSLSGSVSSLADDLGSMSTSIADALGCEGPINNSINSVAGDVNTLSESVSTLDNSVYTLNGSVSTMYEEIYGIGGGGLVEDLSVLGTNVSSLSDSVSSLSSSVSTHEDSISTITDNVSSLSDSVSTLNDSLYDFVGTMTGNCAGGTMGGVIGSINESVSTLNDSVSTIEESLSTALADMPQVTDGEGNGAYDFEVYYSIYNKLELPSWWTSASVLEEASFTVNPSENVYNVPIFHAVPTILHVDTNSASVLGGGNESGLIYYESYDFAASTSTIAFCSVEHLESFDFVGHDGTTSTFPGPQIHLLGGHEKIEIKISEADAYFSGLQTGADGEYIDTTSAVSFNIDPQISNLNVFEHMTPNTKFVYFYNDDYNYTREIKIRYPRFSVSNSVEQMTMQTTTLGVGEVVGFRLIHGNFDAINVEVPYNWALQPINSVTV